MNRPSELQLNNNVDTRIWHAMEDECCETFTELVASLRRYKYGRPNFGKKCWRRLKELAGKENPLTHETVKLLSYLEDRGLSPAQAVAVLEHAVKALVVET